MSWRIFETDRYEYQPLEGGGSRLVWLLNTTDMPEIWLHYPATDDQPETYTQWLSVAPGRTHVDVFKKLSAINYASFGGAKSGFRAYGSGRLNIGPHMTIMPGAEPFVAFSGPLTFVKDGKKYLRVRVGGQNYGIKLEPLE